jgi:hypothetical protein
VPYVVYVALGQDAVPVPGVRRDLGGAQPGPLAAPGHRGARADPRDFTLTDLDLGYWPAAAGCAFTWLEPSRDGRRCWCCVSPSDIH